MNQQFEFENENAATRERQLNEDPREQGYRESIDYRAHQPVGNQKIYPMRPRPRRGLAIFLIIVIILALLGGASFLTRTLFTHTVNLEPHKYNVAGDVPTLKVQDTAGHITFHTGDAHRVVIQATEHVGPFSQNLDVHMSQSADGNEIDVIVDDNGHDLPLTSVDLDITLPQTSTINATTDAGSMDIDGISGVMNLQADAGSINVKNSMLSPGSTLTSDAGSINFDGSLAEGGKYSFTTDAGSINLTLPGDASFILDAQTDAGSVNNDFGSNTFGTNPSAIEAHSDAGSINIHKKR